MTGPLGQGLLEDCFCHALTSILVLHHALSVLR